MATKDHAAKKPAPRARRPAPKGEAVAPEYRLVDVSFIENKLLPVGAKVTYYGVPGRALQPLNTAAKANKAAVQEIRREHRGNPEALADALRDLDNDLQNITPVDEYNAEDEVVLTEAEIAELEAGETKDK